MSPSTHEIAHRYEELVVEAEAAVGAYSPAEAVTVLDEDGVVFVDVRDALELATGMVRGAVHASRGCLEAHLNPDSPRYRSEFDDAEELVFYCATGPRSVLAARQAQRLGLERVAHLEGGFAAWVTEGGPIESSVTETQ